MNNSKKENKAVYGCPYDDLFIYYIQGRGKLLNQIDTDTFIGNWEEDDFSFLFFSEQSDNTVAQVLKNESELLLLDQYHMTYEEWQGGYARAFESRQFYYCAPPEDVRRYNSGCNKHTS